MSDLKAYGYADGLYMNKCQSCPKTFYGAKRAFRCRPCAEEADQKRRAETQTTPLDPVRVPQLCRDECVVRHSGEMVRKLDHAVVAALLVAKLHSEAEEIARDLTNPEEYGDLLDTLEALAERMGVAREDIEQARQRKHAAKGHLHSGLFWQQTSFVDPKEVQHAAE